MRRTTAHLRFLCLLLAVQVICLQIGAGLSFFYCPNCVALRFTAECPQSENSCCVKVKSCCAKKSVIKSNKAECCVKIQLPDAEGAKLLTSSPVNEKLHLVVLPESSYASFFALSAKWQQDDSGPDPPPTDSPSGRSLLLRSSILLI